MARSADHGRLTPTHPVPAYPPISAQYFSMRARNNIWYVSIPVLPRYTARLCVRPARIPRPYRLLLSSSSDATAAGRKSRASDPRTVPGLSGHDPKEFPFYCRTFPCTRNGIPRETPFLVGPFKFTNAFRPGDTKSQRHRYAERVSRKTTSRKCRKLSSIRCARMCHSLDRL